MIDDISDYPILEFPMNENITTKNYENIPLSKLVLAEDLKSCEFSRKCTLSGKQKFVINFTEKEMEKVFHSLSIYIEDNDGQRILVNNLDDDNFGLNCSVNILGGESLQNMVSESSLMFSNGGLRDILNFLMGCDVRITCANEEFDGILISHANKSYLNQENNTQNLDGGKNEVTLFCPISKSISIIECDSISSISPKNDEKIQQFEYFIRSLSMVHKGKKWQILINSEVLDDNKEFTLYCEYTLPINLESKIYYKLYTETSKLECSLLITNSTMETWENVTITNSSVDSDNCKYHSSRITVLPGYSTIVLHRTLNLKTIVCHGPSGKFVKIENTSKLDLIFGELSLSKGNSTEVLTTSYRAAPGESALYRIPGISQLIFSGLVQEIVTLKNKCIDLMENNIVRKSIIKNINSTTEILVKNPTNEPLVACFANNFSKPLSQFANETVINHSTSSKNSDLFYLVQPRTAGTIKLRDTRDTADIQVDKLTHSFARILCEDPEFIAKSNICMDLKNIVTIKSSIKSLKENCNSLNEKISKELTLLDKLSNLEKTQTSNIIEDLVKEEREKRYLIETKEIELNKLIEKCSIPVSIDLARETNTFIGQPFEYTVLNPTTAKHNYDVPLLPKTYSFLEPKKFIQFNIDPPPKQGSSGNINVYTQCFGSIAPGLMPEYSSELTYEHTSEKNNPKKPLFGLGNTTSQNESSKSPSFAFGSPSTSNQTSTFKSTENEKSNQSSNTENDTKFKFGASDSTNTPKESVFKFESTTSQNESPSFAFGSPSTTNQTSTFKFTASNTPNPFSAPPSNGNTSQSSFNTPSIQNILSRANSENQSHTGDIPLPFRNTLTGSNSSGSDKSKNPSKTKKKKMKDYKPFSNDYNPPN